MEKYLHRVVGFYPSLIEANHARDLIVAKGVAATRIRVLPDGTSGAEADMKADSDDVRKDLLRDGAIGTAVGTVAGGGAAIALASADVGLFLASPMLGALYLVGWTASLGGFLGALVGAQRSKGDVSILIRKALARGQIVLVVHARTESETAVAQQIVGRNVAPTMEDRTPTTLPAAG